MLIEEGHKPAVWMSELDQENNAGAHLNTKSFVKADGGSADGNNNSYGPIEDMTKPQAMDLPINWAGADMNR